MYAKLASILIVLFFTNVAHVEDNDIPVVGTDLAQAPQPPVLPEDGGVSSSSEIPFVRTNQPPVLPKDGGVSLSFEIPFVGTNQPPPPQPPVLPKDGVCSASEIPFVGTNQPPPPQPPVRRHTPHDVASQAMTFLPSFLTSSIMLNALTTTLVGCVMRQVAAVLDRPISRVRRLFRDVFGQTLFMTTRQRGMIGDVSTARGKTISQTIRPFVVNVGNQVPGWNVAIRASDGVGVTLALLQSQVLEQTFTLENPAV